MKRRALEIIIAPSGSLQIDAVGFNGSECEQASAFLEQALGTITNKQRKPEYQQQARRKQHQRISA